MTWSSTIAMPAMTPSTSASSMPSGSTALTAKGNSSSTVTLMKSGDPRDQPSQSVSAKIGTEAIPKATRWRRMIRCQPCR